MSAFTLIARNLLILKVVCDDEISLRLIYEDCETTVEGRNNRGLLTFRLILTFDILSV